MLNLSAHNWHDMVTGAVAYSSVIMRFLPPPEKFGEYPRFQRYYKLGWIFLNYAAFNKNGVNGNGSTK